MMFQYSSCLGDYSLRLESEDKSLRPWDAADEYLLNTLSEMPFQPCSVAVFNDRYGALSVPLGERVSVHVTDSLIEREDTACNLEENRRRPLPSCSTLDAWDASPDLILMRIPKSVEYFSFQLAQLKRRIFFRHT